MNTIKQLCGPNAVLVQQISPGVFSLDTPGAMQIGVAHDGGVSGLHILGDGTFSVNGNQTQLWLDADDDNPYAFMFTNETAGIGRWTAGWVHNDGSFTLACDGSTAFLAYSTSTGNWGFGVGASHNYVEVPSLLTTAKTVATLPATPVVGQRSYVTDSNAASFTAGIGAVVAAGGSTKVPVVFDGTNWRIG